MTFTTRKAAALAAAAALAMSGATGVANAQSGTLSSDSLGAGIDLGSVEFVPGGDGSIDTSGSLIGEPTLGSLAEPASEVLGSVRGVTGSSILNPAGGNGSLDTSGSLNPLNPGSAGEPTTGSLADIYAPVAGSLGIGQGFTTVVSDSLGTGTGTGTGSLVPVVLGVGSVAAVGAGIYYAPEIRAAIENAGFELPPLPPLPQFPNLLPPPPAPAPAPAECECP